MNVYGNVILGMLLLDFLLNLTADLLNIRAASPTVPPEFEGVYDATDYARAQRYLRAGARLDLVFSATELAALLGFWLAGGFAGLDRAVRAVGWGPVPTGLLFIGALVLARAAIELPFRCYRVFVVESRFGFNRTTWRTFLLDILKTAALALVLGTPLLAVILLFFEYAGARAWLYCWAVTAGFILVMQFVAPAWILPLFNRFTPLEEGSLRQAIQALLARLNFPVRGLFVIDGSRRSTHSNAYVAGFGRFRRIALFDTLIARHSVPELVSIVAHELGHWKRKHVLLGTCLGVAHAGVLFGLLALFLRQPALHAAFGLQLVSAYAGLAFFSLLYTPVELALATGLNAVSRRNEYAADHFAATITDGPASLGTALKKLSVHNLSNLTPHWLTVLLHYSHPPILVRLAALRRLADNAAGTDPQADSAR